MHHFSINKIYAPVSERSINDIPQEVAAQYNTPIIYSVTPQLNQTIIPMHYDINLDLTEVTSHNHVIGRMAIYLKTTTHDLKNQKEIKLHVSANVFLQRIRLRGGNKTITITAIKRQKQLKMLLLVLEEELIYSDYLLEMEFSTKICTKECEGVQCIMKNNEIVGFTTKFEPFFARTLLPCWDSPNFKSTFNVTIKHDPSKTVLSNGMIGHQTDILSRANKKHMQMTSFKKTPVMSVYLLAFVYGDFAKFESRSQRNVSISIYTEPSTQYLTHFAANFTPTMLDLLETEFRIKYPMEKIDFVATANLPVGGIENWGLVIFHNNMLLIENDRSNSPQMSVDHLYDTIKIEKIVTHELIHQWIGNLVSVNDWSEIWINEGFATFYVYKILRESHRAVMDQEYLTRLSDLIEQQCGEFKTSLIQEFTRDTLYSDLFQPIGVYVRGSVVVQMIQNLVGEDAFADGMITFLTRNSYRSVDRHTLWASMPPLSSWGKEKEILGSVMESWLVNKGIPEITISRNYNDHSIRLTQQLSDLNKYAIFLNDNHPLKGPKARRVNRNIRVKAYNIERVGRGKIKVQNIEDNERMDIPKTSRSTNYDENKDVWSIPFSYQFHSLKSEKYKFTKQFWLHNETILFTDKDISSNVLLLANPDWLFPFKVNYDIQNWRMIIDMLHSNLSEIPTKSRIQLIIDSKTYIMHSGVPELYVQLLGYLHHETELCVLLFGIDAVYNLIDTYRGSSIGEQLVMYLQQVIQKFDTTLSKSDYDAEVAAVWLIDADRISKLYKLRCIAELESCESLKHRNQWLRQPTALDVEEYQQITGICSYLFNEAGYEEINLLMKFLEYRSQQWTVNVALSSCIKEEALLKHVVKKIIETKNAAVYMSVLEVCKEL
uniref:Aminopeptidase n=1 Tax=Rhabditophanes sp. KR3021 TaxID=114890 RepID=A0AC35TZD3_9BILA